MRSNGRAFQPIHLKQSLSRTWYHYLTAITDRRYSSQMIIRARTIVTMHGAPVDNGAVAVSGNRIVDVGRFNDIKTRQGGDIVDLGEQALLPGLINAHCHLDYTCLRGKISPPGLAPSTDSCSHGPVGRPDLRASDNHMTGHRSAHGTDSSCGEPVATGSFTDWIRAINAEKSKLSPEDFLASINDGFEEAKRFGTTTIANLTAFPELMSKVQPPIRTAWFVELIDIRAPIDLECADMSASATGRIRRGELLKRSRSRGIAALKNPGLAPHALFTASEDLFRRCDQIAQQDHMLLTTHLAESREEMEMFREASGPLYEFIKSIGRPMDDCGNETPVELFLGALWPRRASCGRALPTWILAHLNELHESDFELLKQTNSKFHVVHCPGSHNYFGHSPFLFERLRSFVNVCLGTDSLASNESLSLFAETRAFQKKFPSVSAQEIFQMVTVNPARALRQENALGQIRPGFRADLIAVPCSSSTDIFEQILAFDAPVPWSMIDGNVIASVPGSAGC